MKQRKIRKKGMALLLAAALTITVFPQAAKEVHAAALPDSTQFAMVDELKAFNTDDRTENGGDGKNPAKVYFGNNNQQWWIAGSQSGNLTVFAASPLKTKQKFESNWNQKKTYDSDWGCDYTSTGDTAPTEVYPNHYGASPLRDTLKGLETSYFTSEEQKLMNDMTVHTNDTLNGSTYSTTDKLYLAYGDYSYDQYITVGANEADSLNGGLRIDKGYWGNAGRFWLRAPYLNDSGGALVVWPGFIVDYNGVNDRSALVPAFELNLSSVIFASAAPAASSDGELKAEAADGNGAFTLRHSGKALGAARISYDKSKIALTNVSADTYLVIQNKDGAWAKKIKNETSIAPGDVTGFSQDSFENCMVWLETTDDVNRITYAALASCSVKVTGNTGLSITSGNGTQEVAQGKEIQPITVTADDGYYFPENYYVAAQNGISVTRESYTRLMISGKPTADVDIKLPAATKKADRAAPIVAGGIGLVINGTDETMEYAESETSSTWKECAKDSTKVAAGPWYVRYKETDTQKASPATRVEVIAPTYTITVSNAPLDFGAQNEGYGSATGQSVTITNTGNSKVTLKEPISSNYGVSLSDNKIEPNQEVELTVSPNPGLGAGSYDETIVTQTEQGTSATLDVSFKVNGALEVSLAASPKEIVEGQSATLTAEAQGGSGTYAYTWHVDGVENASLTGSEVTVYPTATTTYKVVVTDTIEGKNATATVTVVPKSYKLEVPADIAFERHIGDTKAGAERVSIKNTGNVDVTNISAVLSETNANVFTLDTTGMQTTLSPSGETAFSVTPNAAGLAVGTYKAEVRITGDNGVTANVSLSFNVSGHSFTSYVSDGNATCTADGTKTAQCDYPGCLAEDKQTERKLGHTGGVATCSAKAVCSRCGTEYGDVDPNNHVNTEVRNKKDAAVSEDGYTGDIYCNDCNKIVETGTVIPATGSPDEKDPDIPVISETKPVKPDKTVSQTGDTNNVWLWFILAAVSGVLLTGSAAYRRKQKRTNKRNCRHSRGM